MTINNAHRYLTNIWDWGDLFGGCFPNDKISLSDLDGALERNGYLLILETKAVSADLSGGQRIAFTHLCKTGLTSVIVVWGRPGQPEACQIYHRGQVEDRQSCDRQSLRRMVSAWYSWASRQPAAWTLTQPRRPDAGSRQTLEAQAQG